VRPGRVHSINRSSGGVPKSPVAAAWVDENGVEGDWQNDRKHHGGPARAVCVYALEVIEALAAEGHPIFPGSTRENLTIAGLDWQAIQPGDCLEVGELELEITSFTSPCKTISGSFSDRAQKRISHKLFPGWSRVYARVLQPGRISVGGEVRHVPQRRSHF